MTLEKAVYDIIDEIEALHPEDPRIRDKWSKLAGILSDDEAATIQLLSRLEDENAVGHISAAFHDVAERLQSEAFISCIESLIPKFPKLTLVHMVDWAKDAMPE